MTPASIISFVFSTLSFLIFARVILSWIRISPYDPKWGQIVTTIYQLTDPIIEPVRRILPPMGGLDFSPIIVLFLLNMLRNFIIRLVI